MGPKMPVSLVCESQTDVSSAIRNSLSSTLNNGSHNGLNSGPSDSLQNQFVASAKRALLTKIDYEEVSNFNNSVHDTLKSKYTVLKPPTSTVTTATATVTSNNNGKSMVNGTDSDKTKNFTGVEKKGAELPTPKYILFPRDQVQIGWKNSDRKWLPGAGMMNVGNTCYLNSTLQALFHVPALANWLVSDSQHRETCEDKTGIQGGCIICAMAKTLIASQQSNAQAIKPYLIYSKLRLVCKHLVLGQQEDAHEFLRYLMEALEKAYLLRIPKSVQLDQYSKETTPINQILGGYLKTSVRCLACSHVSVTFQHFEDLLLDIRKANTVEEALDLYFARERLEDMGYKCESCKKKVSATKQFSLERAPISLCIQLKRFSIVGNKLNKPIAIRQQLNLTKYSSRKSCNEQLIYRLVSMVTHLGASQHCGHYTAIGWTDAGSYYQFDDSYVRQISVQSVLNTNAYIMFYELETSSNKGQAQPHSCMESNKLNGNGDRIRSFIDLKGSSRNNVTTTVTSGANTKQFIGPLLPLPTSKLNTIDHDSNENSSITANNIEQSHKKSASPSVSTFNPIAGKTITNGVNKINVGSKLVNAYKKNERSPIIIKITSNGSRYVSSINITPETSASSLNGNLERSITNGTANSSDDEDVSTEKFEHDAYTSDRKETSLPSMPKLDITTESVEINEKTLSTVISPTKSKINANVVPKVTSPIAPLPVISNDKVEQQDDESDSDSSSDDTKLSISNISTCLKTVSAKSTPLKAKSLSSTPILLVNSNGKQRTSKLVPYALNDDSEYESGTESPPEVKTKAGTFLVTKTNTPRVISTFFKNSTERSPIKPSSASTPASAGNTSTTTVKFLNGRRESDGNTSVNTVASAASVSASKRPCEWHGNETASKLLKLGHRGYGATVSTWNGQKSNMEKEVNDDRKEELKRQMLSSNDAEMDRGHKKKVNTKQVLGRDNPGYNPFQEHQTQRNSWTISNGNPSNGHINNSSGHASFKNQIFRQNPHSQRFNHGNHKNKFNRNQNGGGRRFGNNFYHFQNRQTNKNK